MHRAAIALLLASSLIGVAVAHGRDVASPSGVLYTRNVNGAYAVWELDGSAGDGHRLFDAASDPVWSSDGSRVAFTRQRSADPSSGSDLATARADGSDLRILTGDGKSGGPAWSPDGSQLAFSRSGDQAAIALVGSSGGPPTTLTHPPAGEADFGPSWSPAGHLIAFSRRSTSFTAPDAAVWIVDVASGTETRLTPADIEGSGAAWSPDGTHIAYLSDRDHDGRTYGEDETTPNAEIYTMAADGSDPRRITHTRGPESSVAWSASGRRLIYAAAPAGSGFGPYELVLSRADGGCPTTLTHGSAWHLGPSPPPGESLDSVTLQCAARTSASGSQIAAAPGLARQRVHGGRTAEIALARRLLGQLGATTTIRSIAITTPPAGRRAPSGTSWLRIAVTGIAKRNAAEAVRPSWEAGLLADRYASLAAAHGARALSGLSIHYLGSGRTVSTTEAARHEFVGTEHPNEVVSAIEIERSLRAAILPKGVELASVRFARLDGGSAPEIVLRIGAKSAAGRLFTLAYLLLDPLQLDQGAYVELRSRCGALIGALGEGDLGTRQRVGTIRAAGC